MTMDKQDQILQSCDADAFWLAALASNAVDVRLIDASIQYGENV